MSGRKGRCRSVSHFLTMDMQRVGHCLCLCFRGGGPKGHQRNITTLSLFTVMCAAVAVVITVHTYQYFNIYGMDSKHSRSSDESFMGINPPAYINNTSAVQAGASGLTLAKPKEESGEMKWSLIQEQRKQQIKDICQQVLGNFDDADDELPAGALRDTLVDAKNKVMFCPLLLDPWHKTTSWEAGLKMAAHESLRWDFSERIAGVKPNKQDGYFAPGNVDTTNKETRSITPSMDWMKKHTKILFVEHPFEKLASVYRARIKTRQGFLGSEVGKKILAFSRGFGNLTRDILESGEIGFKEMASFILRRDLWDPHWKTVYDVCHPCEIDYDYIIKADTLRDDIKGILRQMHPSPKARMREVHKFASLTEYEEPKVNRLLQKQYEGMDTFDMLMLYDQYSIDMFMFDYSWPFERLSVPQT